MEPGGKRLEALEQELTEYLQQRDIAQFLETPLHAPFIWRLRTLWKAWGVSPLELLSWPSELVEQLQLCDVVEARLQKPG